MCELDIIFHFEKAYFILDEFLFAGEVQETGPRSIMAVIDAQDMLQEVIFSFDYVNRSGGSSSEFVRRSKPELRLTTTFIMTKHEFFP